MTDSPGMPSASSYCDMKASSATRTVKVHRRPLDAVVVRHFAGGWWRYILPERRIAGCSNSAEEEASRRAPSKAQNISKAHVVDLLGGVFWGCAARLHSKQHGMETKRSICHK